MAYAYVIVVGVLLSPMMPMQACCGGSAAVAPEEVSDPTKTEKFQHFLNTAHDNQLYCVLSVITENKLDYHDIGRYKPWASQIQGAINQTLAQRNPLKTVNVRPSISLVQLIPAATVTSSPQPSPITAVSGARYKLSVSDMALSGARVSIHKLSPRWHHNTQKHR